MGKTTTATKVKNIIAWIDWLQSGKVNQARGQLVVQETKEDAKGKESVCWQGFCCLGVASLKVLGARIDKEDVFSTTPSILFGRGDATIQESGSLPEGHFERLGLRSSMGAITLWRDKAGNHHSSRFSRVEVEDALYVTLAELNDGYARDVYIAEPKGKTGKKQKKRFRKTITTPGVSFAKIAELLLLDLRTGQLGIFETSVAAAWRAHYNFTE